ncbi:hypothetical protein EIP91_001560 [Steccherinum ochraceum]|uniref:CENP-V/GFA domain-containing protein n=1 Tax=Steccherinum ochraceum TaxID=92696 RepID=A0A4R0RUG2_9APHY|nr:hypothetical protein EIP91_001560 [Steccherinum ochraceum]
MPKVFHGTCLCGEVAFEINADPMLVSTCHCLNCKKFTGTAFSTNVIFPDGSINITKGRTFVNTYSDAAQDSKNTLGRVFCSQCSSPLYNIGRDGNLKIYSVFYSALDDFDIVADPHGTEEKEETKKDVVPAMEFYTKDRVGWVTSVPGAQQHSATLTWDEFSGTIEKS